MVEKDGCAGESRTLGNITYRIQEEVDNIEGILDETKREKGGDPRQADTFEARLESLQGDLERAYAQLVGIRERLNVISRVI